MTLLIAGLSLMGTLIASPPSQAVAPMGGISGQVIEDGTDAPVPGARVFVVLDGHTGPPPATLTDEDGRFHFDALPAGRYRIAAQKAGFAPPITPSTMQMVEVTAGRELDGVTVSLQRGGVIAGRILDPFGQPLAEVGVTALLKRLISNDRPTGTSPGAPLLMPTSGRQTNDLGEFRLYGLSPGEYVIAANPREDFGSPVASSSVMRMANTFFPGTTDVAAAQPVTVQAGQTVDDLTIHVVAVPAFEVSGTVVDETGAPVAGLLVMLLGDRAGSGPLLAFGTGPLGMSQSDGTGRFTFGGVPAGSYTLRSGGSPGGFFASSEDFVIGGDGTPRAGTGLTKPPALGTIELIVETANVSDLKLVVPKSR